MSSNHISHPCQQQYLTAEYVLPGHPDKLCDAIADALVQEASRRQRRALCGVEVAVHRASVFVTGRIACADAESIDVPAVVRGVFASAGYDREWGPAPSKLKVHTDLCLVPLEEGEAEFRAVADDQSIVTGYAIDLPATNYLPPEHFLAYRLCLALGRLRAHQPELRLGPDGKVIATLAQEDAGDDGIGRFRLSRASFSVQQSLGGDAVGLHRAINALVRAELLQLSGGEREQAKRNDGGAIRDDAVDHGRGDADTDRRPRDVGIAWLSPEPPAEIAVNAAGNFAVGGPEGDNGLSGKKLVVDAYGPRVPIGGGALSGKDFFKADRAGAILARRLAKLVVLAGAAPECLATLAWHPGDREARIVRLIDARASQPLAIPRWAGLIDLSLEHAGERYTASHDLIDVARHGHFTSAERPWERIVTV